MSEPAVPLTQVYIPPRSGRAIDLLKGQRLKVVDIQGQQVGDLFAFNRTEPLEFISPSDTRTANWKLTLNIGDVLYSNRRGPFLLVLDDTVGTYDLLVPSCDPVRYRDSGHTGTCKLPGEHLGSPQRVWHQPICIP